MSALPKLEVQEDPIECPDVKKHGCAFWRGDWYDLANNQEGRSTVREFGHGGPGYTFFEMRNKVTKARTSKQDWYQNYRNFKPHPSMRLIADYREVSA